MSLRLAIPRPVGLHQSPPPLCQPRISLTEIRYFEKEKSWNGRCANNGLSQLRGSPHDDVPKCEPSAFPLCPKSSAVLQETASILPARLAAIPAATRFPFP